MPRFDSPPVFGALLDESDGGRFSIAPRRRRRRRRSATCRTRTCSRRASTDADGAFRVLDFAPRFMQYERSFRPTKLVRIVEPLSGTPRIRVRCDPVLGWSRSAAAARASARTTSRYEGFDAELRLTTDVPLSYLDGEPFALTERKHFVLSWGAPVEEPLAAAVRALPRARPCATGRRWVKHCDIPPLYQEEVIRSALALKLHCFEDTGAIVAAMTTSIPEAPGSRAHLGLPLLLAARRVLRARRVPPARALRGARAVPPATCSTSRRRRPTSTSRRSTAIDGKTDLDERILDDWPGFAGERPGARRQRRRHAPAARRLRRDGARAHAAVPRRALPRAGRRRRCSTSSTRLARKAIAVAGTAGRRHLGVPHRVAPADVQLADVLGRGRSHGRIARAHRPADADEFAARGRADPRRDPRARPSTRRAAAWSRTTAAPRSTPRCCRRSRCASCRPTTRGMHATVDAIRADLDHDGWLQRYRTRRRLRRARRSRSSSARSGSSRRSRGSAAPRRRGA